MKTPPHRTTTTLYIRTAELAKIDAARRAARVYLLERAATEEERAAVETHTHSRSAWMRYCAMAYGSAVKIGSEAQLVANAAVVALAQAEAELDGIAWDARTAVQDQTYMARAALRVAQVHKGAGDDRRDLAALENSAGPRPFLASPAVAAGAGGGVSLS